MRITFGTHGIAAQIFRLIGHLWLLVFLASLWPVSVLAQSSQAQRNALKSVRAQVHWLESSTRTASNFGLQGYVGVLRSFQEVRQAFVALTQTLTPQQSAYGANDLAKLNAELETMDEAIANYQKDVTAGRPAGAALARMCQVLRQCSALWLQDLNKTSSRLRIGRS